MLFIEIQAFDLPPFFETFATGNLIYTEGGKRIATAFPMCSGSDSIIFRKCLSLHVIPGIRFGRGA